MPSRSFEREYMPASKRRCVAAPPCSTRSDTNCSNVLLTRPLDASRRDFDFLRVNRSDDGYRLLFVEHHVIGIANVFFELHERRALAENALNMGEAAREP